MTEVSIPLYSSGIIKVQAAVLLNTLMLGKKIPELIFPTSSHFLMEKRNNSNTTVVKHNLGDLYFSKRTMAHSYLSESLVIRELQWMVNETMRQNSGDSNSLFNYNLQLESGNSSWIIIVVTSAGSLKKQESSRKTSISALLTMSKPLTVWITINSEEFLKRWAYQTTWPASWEVWMKVRKQQLELDMEQQTGSK